MKLKKKLLLAFVSLAALVVLVGVRTVYSLNEITKDVAQIDQSSILEVESSTEMAFELLIMEGLFKDYINAAIKSYPAEIASIKKRLEKSFVDFETALEARKEITIRGLKLYNDEEVEGERGELNQIKYLANKYREYKNEALEIIADYEKTGYVAEQKLHGEDWKERNNVLIKEVKLFKSDAQYEITAKTKQVMDEAQESTNLAVVIASISFILAIIAGLFIAKSIVAPIVKLKTAAQNIASGNMDFINDIHTGDEIGELAFSFNKMTLDLKKSRSEIEGYNKTLEQKVNERTNELEGNIKKLKQTEEKLKDYASDLKSSNKELEQFAYVASHDLQEPLRTTSNFVELFQQQYKGKLDKNAEKYLSYIVQSTERMRLFITDLLEYSRIGSSKELKQIDCNKVLDEVVADLDAAIKDTGAKINTDTLPVIFGYPTEIKQLFQNLIFNAIKFRKKNTHPEIKVSAHKDSDKWQFSFTDNGIGIAKEHSERIFIIFQRLHNRSEYPGSGIGLSHCKKIVELHKGNIWLESELGKGATFYFMLPERQALPLLQVSGKYREQEYLNDSCMPAL
jgi:signal transduction histidine kinase